VVVDGSAGWTTRHPAIPPHPILGNLVSAKSDFGSATGILGGRYTGLSEFLNLVMDDASEWKPANNAVSSLDNVVASKGNDVLKGNYKDNIFILGQGGQDTVDGGDNKKIGDTISFETSTTGITSTFGNRWMR